MNQVPIIGKKWHRAGIILSSIHFVLVIGIVAAIFSGSEVEWPMLWLFLIPCSFPISLIYLGASRLLYDSVALKWRVPMTLNFVDSTSPLSDIGNFWLPFVIMGIGGTIWWFYAPRILRWLMVLGRSVIVRKA